ncbi:hypothetical protein BsWGS_18713 [Bradybaena similaris]
MFHLGKGYFCIGNSCSNLNKAPSVRCYDWSKITIPIHKCEIFYPSYLGQERAHVRIQQMLKTPIIGQTVHQKEQYYAVTAVVINTPLIVYDGDRCVAIICNRD